MDILDIDEALKDDSFIFLEDKTHDDVSNILQQWRNNNCSSGHSSSTEQAFKLNTRTFTRPKRKTAQNLETLFNPLAQSQNATQTQPNSQQQQPPQNVPLNVNLEIGGLVTNMQKSFLQDTSPPSSICSSMDVSLYGMNSSLITSSDFLSNNLLQSIHGGGGDVPMSGLFFDGGEKTPQDDIVGGYTLNDMIRDRKALESLSLSAEGTLIKDSNIAQIDDISLINSKTTSACSTMNNSVDSMGGAGSDTFSSRTCNIAEKEEKEKEQQESLPEKSFDQKMIFNETFPSGKEQIVPNGDDDYIGNTTFNLVDSSILTVQQPVVAATTAATAAEMKAFNDLQNETFQRPIMEETICLKRFSIAEGINTTFDCSEPNLVQCETPENNVKYGKHYEQSTPHQNTSFTSMRHKQNFTPSIDVNISPIVGGAPNRTLNGTFEKPVSIISTNILKERVQNETFSEPQQQQQQSITSRLPCNDDVNNAIETIELLENINPNETFNKCIPFSKSIPGGTPAVDTADEEAFNNLLDNFGKLELNEEQIKMQKSLDTIKRRFNTTMDKSEAKETNSQICSPEMGLSGFSMNTSGGDRLLSRRSRLYDGVNITQPSQKNSPSGSVSSNSSFVKETEVGGERGEAEEIHKKTDEQQHCTGTGTELSNNPNAPQTQDNDKVPRNSSKLEKRDRDRFRTIRIFKRTENGTSELNVPCIDGENEHLPSTEEEDETPQATTTERAAPMERLSRRDITPSVMYNNNNNKTETESSNNYATFKKPKAKMSRYGGGFGMNGGDQLIRPVIAPPPPAAPVMSMATEKPTEQRSLSRPRYISGLQKFSASSKAISAGDLEKAEQQSNSKSNGDAFNKTQPSNGIELKSPMGIKSKSFHNLSSNFGYAKATPAAAPAMAAPTVGGVRKSTTAGSVLTEKQGKFNTTKTTIRVNSVPGSNLKQPVSKNEKSDDSVFKTPSLVSGLRAPSAKRTGLLRPSSGYYSFGVAKGGEAATTTTNTNAADIDAGRHSPTDSMSSASSRGSSNGKLFNNNGSSTQIHEAYSMPPPSPLQQQQQQPVSKTTTGIPKPSGLRPPSSIKRSGLPRPSSIVRR